MDLSKKDPERITPLEFDDSIFRPVPERRVDLPSDDRMIFEEVQTFSQVWLWALLGIELVVVLIVLLSVHLAVSILAPVLVVMVLPLIMLSALKLTTRMDYTGVHYRVSVFQRKETTIPWEDIDQIYVRKYSPILEYGGWGIRFGPNGKALNVRGNYGIQIIRKNGRKLLLGTQQPEEASHYLSTHPLLV